VFKYILNNVTVPARATAMIRRVLMFLAAPRTFKLMLGYCCRQYSRRVAGHALHMHHTNMRWGVDPVSLLFV
jgi:hypothetical protein